MTLLTSIPLVSVSEFVSESARDSITQREQSFLLAVRRDDAQAAANLVDETFRASILNGALRLAIAESSVSCLAALLDPSIGADPQSIPSSRFFDDLEVIDVLVEHYRFSTTQLSSLMAIWLDHDMGDHIATHLGSGKALLQLIDQFYSDYDDVNPNTYSSLPAYDSYLDSISSETLPEKLFRLNLLSSRDILTFADVGYARTQDAFLTAAEEHLTPEEFADPELQACIFCIRSLNAIHDNSRSTGMDMFERWFSFADKYATKLSIDLDSDDVQDSLSEIASFLRSNILHVSEEVRTVLRLWKELSTFSANTVGLLPLDDLFNFFQLPKQSLRPETYLALDWLHTPSDIDKVVTSLTDPNPDTVSVSNDARERCVKLDSAGEESELVLAQIVAEAIGRSPKSARLL